MLEERLKELIKKFELNLPNPLACLPAVSGLKRHAQDLTAALGRGAERHRLAKDH